MSDAFSPSWQRQMGQYMTPPAVADAMVDAIAHPPASWRVLDPACGDGNLLLAAARRLAEHGVKDIHRKIAGIDLDPAMIACARERLAAQLRCDPNSLMLWNRDFLDAVKPSLLEEHPLRCSEFNVVLSNPPYGKLREYRFFEAVCEYFRNETELVFLVPLSFLDRVEGVSSTPLDGRPLGVTTGHAIVHHRAGDQFHIHSVRGFRDNSTPFSVLSGVKLYEVGAGTPVQTRQIAADKPYSSETPVPGWIPCVRTGDIHAFSIEANRLWVHYGPHLAHPKDLARFSGPRLFVRRMPIWGSRQLGAVFLTEQVLCAGDVLVVRHADDDPERLRGLCVFLNSPEAADFVLTARPSVKHRDSYPKISAKDINRLLESRVPDNGTLARLASQYGDPVPASSSRPSLSETA